MKTFALSRKDGGIYIMQIVPRPEGFEGDWPATPVECMAEWPEGQRAEIVKVTEIDPANNPQDRSNRDQWTLKGRKIVDAS